MDKAGIAFMGLILVLISLVLSILAVDRTSIEARPNVYATSTPHRFFSCSDLRLIYGPSNELTEEYLTSSL
ncbi:hypothetical protein [Sinorhizobium meliloti]|uniref:hypothetical protein n=1 Tax=Rhizobium meliloti TaxID=382 RepID=UPI0005187077|nr:hypothetical protein [Sinorhizobium meliloti]MDE4618676.1 hypothetical protein [Sinorhizobium meliloti]